MTAETALLGRQMQLAAWVMLLIYTALALILWPRELQFLRAAEPRYRRMFVFLDIGLQACVLATLLPCALVSQLTKPLIIVVLSGFTALWIFVAALAYLRYVYTIRLLVAGSAEQLRRAEAADKLRRQAQEAEDAAGAQDAGR